MNMTLRPRMLLVITMVNTAKVLLLIMSWSGWIVSGPMWRTRGRDIFVQSWRTHLSTTPVLRHLSLTPSISPHSLVIGKSAVLPLVVGLAACLVVRRLALYIAGPSGWCSGCSLLLLSARWANRCWPLAVRFALAWLVRSSPVVHRRPNWSRSRSHLRRRQ